jgi:Pyridoxamine 5'-phosphate oxidase
MASPLERPAVAALLAATPYADVAVATRRGPHATPAAFAAADGRLWVVSSRRTVRVRAIRRTGLASVLVRNGDRSVVVSGAAAVLSPWPPAEAAALAAGAIPATKAAILYTLRNLPIVLAGFAADLVTGAGDPTVYDRVLLGIEADRGVLLDGTEVLDTWGRWRHTANPAPPRADHRAVPPLDDLLAGVPPVPAAALQRRDTAALGWLSPTGAVILPALGGVEDGRVLVSAAALDVVSAGSRSEACITVHDSDTARPSGYRGVVLRGEGRVTRRGPRRATVSVQADRVSWWSGFRAGTSWGPGGRR